jgi:hypothetical protein
MTLRWVQLQLVGPQRQAPGDGHCLQLTERQRMGSLEVVLLVEGTQLALGLPGRGGQARNRGLRAAERGAVEGQSAQQVIPVPMRGKQATEMPTCLLQHRGQRLKLLGQDRRVDYEGLLAGTHDGAVGLPDLAGEQDDVGVKRDDSHWVPQARRATQAMPSSLAASRRVGTSAVGFFWEESRVSLWRLTQITGTRAFRQGATSW